MYAGLTAQCQHFNGLESTYRALASTWLLAAFGGIGYILNGDVARQAMLVGAIGGAAALGVVLLWLLDLQVYHTLLVAAFAEQVRLERENPWLPQAAHLMLAAHDGAGVGPKVVWFYVTAYLLMVAVAAMGISGAVPNVPLLTRGVIAIAIFGLAGLPVVRRMRRSANRPTADVTAYAASRRELSTL